MIGIFSDLAKISEFLVKKKPKLGVGEWWSIEESILDKDQVDLILRFSNVDELKMFIDGRNYLMQRRGQHINELHNRPVQNIVPLGVDSEVTWECSYCNYCFSYAEAQPFFWHRDIDYVCEDCAKKIIEVKCLVCQMVWYFDESDTVLCNCGNILEGNCV